MSEKVLCVDDEPAVLAAHRRFLEPHFDGHVFRFLTKPCAPAALVTAVRAGIEQHRLVTAQRTLLETTVRASVHVLSEVLAMASPAAFGRALRARQLVRDLSAAAGLPDDSALDVEAMLSQL